MRVEAEAEQTIVSSQVVMWKLEVTQRIWNSGEEIFFIIPGKLPGNPNNDNDPLNWLRLTPVEAEDVKSEEKKRIFHFVSRRDEKLTKQVEYRISLKTWDKLNKIKQSKRLVDVETDLQIKLFSQELCDELVSYKEILFVEVTITVLAEERTEDLVPKEFLQNKLKHDRDEQFINETSDVQVVCNGIIFPCHKYVLCSQCPAFKADLFNNCKEKNEGKIEIEDSTPAAVGFMIDYLYGYDTEIPRDSELDILQLAEKYGLIPLKRKCGECMLENLSAGNFLVTYTEIDRYLEGEPEFKEQAKDFLKRNAKEIFVEKDSWVKLTKDFPDLGFELVTSLAKAI